MKKKTAMIATAAALGALLTVGGTLAWFTDVETATNVVTTGNVNISISEAVPTVPATENWTVAQNTDNNGLDYGNIIPGCEILKAPTVQNEGKNAAYIRVKVDISSETEGLDLTGIKFYNGDTEVVLENGYIYLDNALAPKSSTTTDDEFTPFTKVKFPTSWNNDYTDETINIALTAEAIQADHNGTDARAAFSGAEITAYTAPSSAESL